MIRYRTDMNARTGALLTGFPAVRQSVATILTTRLEERVMRLEFGAEILAYLGRNTVPPVVAALYRDAVAAIHRWEPEYRVRRAQLVGLDATGGLELALAGIYYPEGRLGNYTLSEAAAATLALAAGAIARVA